MLSITKALHDARKSSSRPLVLFVLDTVYGQYAWSDITPSNKMLGLTGANLADGSEIANGSITAGSGSLGVISMAQLIDSFGTLSESLETNQGELLSGLSQGEVGSLSVQISNQRNVISKIEARGILLNSSGEIRVGWESCAAQDFLTRFRGKVQSVVGTRTSFTLELAAV